MEIHSGTAEIHAWDQKCFKTVSWRPPGATFWSEGRNASKRPPGDLLELLFGLRPEMLQNGLLETSWSLLLSLGPEMVQNGLLENPMELLLLLFT